MDFLLSMIITPEYKAKRLFACASEEKHYISFLLNFNLFIKFKPDYPLSINMVLCYGILFNCVKLTFRGA